LLTALRTLLELWISPPPTRLRERVEDGRDDGGHDPEQHDGGNETRHHRQHAAYADRSSSPLQGTTPRLASRGGMVLQTLHHRGTELHGSCQIRSGESQ